MKMRTRGGRSAVMGESKKIVGGFAHELIAGLDVVWHAPNDFTLVAQRQRGVHEEAKKCQEGDRRASGTMPGGREQLGGRQAIGRGDEQGGTEVGGVALRG